MSSSQGVPRRVGPDTGGRGFSFRMVTETVSELRRVTWPTRAETIRLPIMVIAVSAVIGAFLGVIDILFAKILGQILG